MLETCINAAGSQTPGAGLWNSRLLWKGPASAARSISACPCERPRAGRDDGGERPRDFKDVIK